MMSLLPLNWTLFTGSVCTEKTSMQLVSVVRVIKRQSSVVSFLNQGKLPEQFKVYIQNTSADLKVSQFLAHKHTLGYYCSPNTGHRFWQVPWQASVAAVSALETWLARLGVLRSQCLHCKAQRLGLQSQMQSVLELKIQQTNQTHPLKLAGAWHYSAAGSCPALSIPRSAQGPEGKFPVIFHALGTPLSERPRELRLSGLEKRLTCPL